MNTVNPEQAWEKYNEQFWAYLAGFLDGEGCIAIIKYCKKTTYYGFGISVSQKDDYILQFLQSMLGGNIGHHHMKKGYGGEFICPAWRIYAKRKVRYILERCLPYFIVKKRQAELTIEALNSMYGEELSYFRMSALDVPQCKKDRIEEIYQEVKALKRRPIAAVTTKREDAEMRSDSLNCNDGKVAELAEMTNRFRLIQRA